MVESTAYQAEFELIRALRTLVLSIKKGSEQRKCYKWQEHQQSKTIKTVEDVYQGVLALYYQLFYFMEDEGILDHLDNLHLIALHHVYLAKLQEKLEIWSRAWSQHRICTTK